MSQSMTQSKYNDLQEARRLIHKHANVPIKEIPNTKLEILEMLKTCSLEELKNMRSDAISGGYAKIAFSVALGNKIDEEAMDICPSPF